MKKIFGVYHIACMNDWKNIFLDQIELIFKNKVMEKIDTLFLTILINHEDDLEFIKDKIKNEKKIKIDYVSRNLKDYEFPALDLIKKLSLNEEFLLFYLHTKGVSINDKNMNFYHGSKNLEHLKNCVNDWRKYMEYFIIENFNICIDELKNCDACGVNLVNSPYKHFSGNFWWSKSDYIKKLPEIKEIDKNHRWNAEFWIGMGNGNLKNFYTTNAGYLERIKTNYKIFC